MLTTINDIFQIIDDDLLMLEKRPQAIWACETAEDMHQALLSLEEEVHFLRKEVKEMKSELIKGLKNGK